MVIAPIKIGKRLRYTHERSAARRVQTNDQHVILSRNDCENAPCRTGGGFLRLTCMRNPPRIQLPSRTSQLKHYNCSAHVILPQRHELFKKCAKSTPLKWTWDATNWQLLHPEGGGLLCTCVVLCWFRIVARCETTVCLVLLLLLLLLLYLLPDWEPPIVKMNRNPNNPDVGVAVKEKLGEFWSFTSVFV